MAKQLSSGKVFCRRLKLSFTYQLTGCQKFVQNLDHLGIVAGIIDEIGLVEQVNQLLGQQQA